MNLSSAVARVGAFFTKLWKKFSSFSRRTQIIIGVIVLIIIGGGLALAHITKPATASGSVPTVTLASLDSFNESTDGVFVTGTVQSVSEANILAQSAGTVEAVNTTLGATVPAGFVIASLDGSAADAAVLQAQGAYDAAVAAEHATSLQSQNSTVSLAQAQTSARNTYQSTYTSLQDVLATDVSTLFGNNTPVGPELLINTLNTNYTFSREDANIMVLMQNWQASLATANTTDPLTLLSTAQSNLTTIASFLTSLTTLASMQGSGATAAQLAGLAAAQSTVSTLQAGVTNAQTSYNASVTAAAVGQTQSTNDSSGAGVTSSQASVEEALGGLRAAQAAYEKTIIRAPFAGTVNYLPITVGNYVSLDQHVATVAQNNALQVILELSQQDANRLMIGDTLTIDNSYSGVVTTIAPALDPTTEQIEVEVAVNAGADLVNGQSVQVALPPLPTSATTVATSTQGIASTTPNIEVPLTAVKLLPNERDVFTVDSTGHLVAHAVQIGQVIGDLIQITTALPANLEIVTDARGLSAGDAVLVASSSPTSGNTGASAASQ